MKLDELLGELSGASLIEGEGSVEVTSVEIDSRLVNPGALFCCIIGSKSDGHDHAQAALDQGAAALLVERDIPSLETPAGTAVIRVDAGQARRAAAVAASHVVGDPSRSLVMAGVTGTNGKTTVATVLGAILDDAGFSATVIGTLTGERTTPAAPDLHRQLARSVREAEVKERPGAVAIEVSSHALDQGRVDGIVFDVAIFTNLSHDHLDYHGTMAAYFDAKALLFEEERSRMAVIWADSDAGAALLSRRRGPAVAVSMADVGDVELRSDGTRFTWRGLSTATGLVGTTGLIDALLAAEAAVALGVDPSSVATSLPSAAGVPGRMERIPSGGDAPTVIVDYAHTPDALSAALEAVESLRGPGGRTILVFGCGGDRDALKRPEMGAIAAARADLAVVTSDNPRYEDPVAIAAQVASGAPDGTLVVELDRRAAIAHAIEVARDVDVVLIAGKGHEVTQQFGDEYRPFDDRLVAAEILREDAAC